MTDADPSTEAAVLLLEARRTGRTIRALPDSVRPRSFAEGYRIQDRLLDLDGRAVGLVKIGCTTAKTQQIMNLDEPIAGCLPPDAIHQSDTTVAAEVFHHQPLIECEFAMRVGSDIDPSVRFDTVADAIAVADAVAPALELVDGRYDSQLGIDGPSVVADNSMATGVVLGRPVRLHQDVDPGGLAHTAVRLVAAVDELLAEGVGSNVLGDPWRSFQWALGHLAWRRRPISAGTWIITGSCSGAPPAPLDRRLTASFDGLGDVSVTIAGRREI